MIATEPALGVRPSNEYLFYVIACAVGAYYKEGAKPTRILVAEEGARAIRGGAGEAKTSGNYGPTLHAAKKAAEDGFTQVLWLDAEEGRYVEEIGTSNIFFRIGEEVVTPSLGGTILHGVTRDSVLALVRHWGMKATERRISIDEVADCCASGQMTEIFATGTAAVISPVGELTYKGRTHKVCNGSAGELSQRLLDEITGIQYGEREDVLGWMKQV